MSVWAKPLETWWETFPQIPLTQSTAKPKTGWEHRRSFSKITPSSCFWRALQLRRSWDSARGYPVLLSQAGSREDVNEDVRGIVPEKLEEIEWGYNLFKSTEHTKYCGKWSSGGKRFGKKAEGTSTLQAQQWQPYRAEILAAICVDC